MANSIDYILRIEIFQLVYEIIKFKAGFTENKILN